MKASSLFCLPDNMPFQSFFEPEVAPWEWVSNIKEALASLDWSNAGLPENIPAGVSIEGNAWIHPSVKLPPYAQIIGPVWIGENTEIRSGAFIRGNVIIGSDCVIGNSCEYKNCLLLNGVKTPHFNYVGDTVLGNGAHLGAGAILANIRMDEKSIPVKTPQGTVDSGMRKLAGLFGDGAEALCNSVIQPGSILGKQAVVMSGVSYSGYLAEKTIAYAKSEIRTIPRRDLQ